MTRRGRDTPPGCSMTDVRHDLGPHVDRLQDAIPSAMWQRIEPRELLRSTFLWWFGRRHHALVVRGTGRGVKWLALLSALSGRRRLVLIETIPVHRTRLQRLASRFVVYPALRRSVIAAQTMTQWERDALETSLALEPGSVVTITSPRLSTVRRPVEYIASDRRFVVASGRAACDWPTFFEAIVGMSWSTIVVCSRADMAEVTRLARRAVTCEVMCELTPEAHDAVLRTARVYVLPLREHHHSVGQMRLMDAASAGAPVVVSRVRGVETYVSPGTTADVVPPGDAAALRDAIDSLYWDTTRAARYVQAAQSHAAGWTQDDYRRELVAFITSALARAVAPAGDQTHRADVS
jgi:glycosyltransferase involved in cell wall biosynthesis